MSINWWMNKQKVAHSFNGIPLGKRQYQNMMHVATWMNFEDVKRKKPDTDRMLYEFICMKCPE